MCRNIIILTFFVLLSGMLSNAAKAADPNLLGWWKLDDGSGATAFDSSNYARHGTINNINGGLGPGGSVWDTDPKRGVVLSFNGSEAAGAYVDAGMIIPQMTLTNDFTWAFWAKQTGDGTGVN